MMYCIRCKPFGTHCMPNQKCCLHFSAKNSKGEHVLVLLSLSTHNLLGHVLKYMQLHKIMHTKWDKFLICYSYTNFKAPSMHYHFSFCLLLSFKTFPDLERTS